MESICYWSYTITDCGDRQQNAQKNQGDHKKTNRRIMQVLITLQKTDEFKQRQNRDNHVVKYNTNMSLQKIILRK